MRPIVIISEHLDPVCAEWLSQRARVERCSYQDQDFSKRLQEAQGLIVRTYTRVDRALLDAAPRLKVVGRAGVGLDNIDLGACAECGVAVVYTPEANTEAVVQYVFALIFDAMRPRRSFDGPIERDVFLEMRRELVGRQIDGLTLGILGFGRIGQRVGRVGDALGMRVMVNDLLPQDRFAQSATARYPYEFVDKPELYRGSDILSLHADGRAENRHLIDADVLAELKPSCLLINTARGLLVDHADLAAWAGQVESRGGGAVLDVHDPEPPPDDHPVMNMTNVRLLPHLASRTQQAMEAMSWVVRDVAAVLEGNTPRYPAN